MDHFACREREHELIAIIIYATNLYIDYIRALLTTNKQRLERNIHTGRRKYSSINYFDIFF